MGAETDGILTKYNRSIDLLLFYCVNLSSNAID
jgi:hypothetical protein